MGTNTNQKLNEFVAENIMGLVRGVDFGDLGKHDWHENEFSEYGQYTCPRCWQFTDDWVDADNLPVGGCHKDAPDYSSNISVAWRVVEKLILDGWDINVWGGGHTDRGEWTCQADFGIGKMIDVTAKTAPLAICRAAREAIEWFSLQGEKQ